MEYFGFGLLGSYRGRPHIDAISDNLELIECADEWGIDGWYMAEHHIRPEFSISAAPNLLTAAVARRTSRLRLGNMVNILPYHHPLRLAEELRTLDALTGGRLEAGFGRGQIRVEQGAFGVVRDETVEMFDAAFDIITRLLRGEVADYDTKWWRGSGAFAIPERTQVKIPLWISAASPESIEKCARLGVGCATALLTRDVADERMSAYRKFWLQYQPDRLGEDQFAVTATIAVAGSEEAAVAQVAKDLEQKQEHFAQAISDKPGADDRTYASHKAQYDAFAASTIESMLSDGLLIAGTVEQCVEQVMRIKQRGIDRLICTFHTAESDYPFSKRSMELFAKEVIPIVEGRANTAEDG